MGPRDQPGDHASSAVPGRSDPSPANVARVQSRSAWRTHEHAPSGWRRLSRGGRLAASGEAVASPCTASAWPGSAATCGSDVAPARTERHIMTEGGAGGTVSGLPSGSTCNQVSALSSSVRAPGDGDGGAGRRADSFPPLGPAQPPPGRVWATRKGAPPVPSGLRRVEPPPYEDHSVAVLDVVRPRRLGDPDVVLAVRGRRRRSSIASSQGRIAYRSVGPVECERQ